MAYEIDFVGVGKDKASQDADALCLRWKKLDSRENTSYIVGVVDGGFEAHGNAVTNHLNQYYFNDAKGTLSADEKIIDFMVVTHPDKDHTLGLKKILENFTVKKIYMNRPWEYVDELYDKVKDNRITKDSLIRRLKKEYSTIADIENIAEEKSIPILKALQGTQIEDNILILSPSEEFYLNLLIESEKTPLEEKKTDVSESISIYKSLKRYVLNLIESWTNELLREDVETSAENETSVVLRGFIDGAGFLLTGDAGIRALNKAMDYMESRQENIQDEISFYQIPHHGGRHNVSPSLLDRMLGKKVKEGETRRKTAFVSVAENSDHPLKMVTNAYIRRGVKVYKTSGNVICHHNGDMPDRGWTALAPIVFSPKVEDWTD